MLYNARRFVKGLYVAGRSHELANAVDADNLNDVEKSQNERGLMFQSRILGAIRSAKKRFMSEIDRKSLESNEKPQS